MFEEETGLKCDCSDGCENADSPGTCKDPKKGKKKGDGAAAIGLGITACLAPLLVLAVVF